MSCCPKTAQQPRPQQDWPTKTIPGSVLALRRVLGPALRQGFEGHRSCNTPTKCHVFAQSLSKLGAAVHLAGGTQMLLHQPFFPASPQFFLTTIYVYTLATLAVVLVRKSTSCSFLRCLERRLKIISSKSTDSVSYSLSLSLKCSILTKSSFSMSIIIQICLFFLLFFCLFFSLVKKKDVSWYLSNTIPSHFSPLPYPPLKGYIE